MYACTCGLVSKGIFVPIYVPLYTTNHYHFCSTFAYYHTQVYNHRTSNIHTERVTSGNVSRGIVSSANETSLISHINLRGVINIQYWLSDNIGVGQRSYCVPTSNTPLHWWGHSNHLPWKNSCRIHRTHNCEWQWQWLAYFKGSVSGYVEDCREGYSASLWANP